MTEPWVASSDATNIQSRIERDGDHYVINAHKWWTSGAASKRCTFAILMGVSDPDADSHRRHSMVLVPLDTPGVTIVRSLPVFGHDARRWATARRSSRTCASRRSTSSARRAAASRSRRPGSARAHPPLHARHRHGRAGAASSCASARRQRVAFGKHLADQGVIQERIAESRIEIEQARLLTMKAAWLIDTVGQEGRPLRDRRDQGRRGAAGDAR